MVAESVNIPVMLYNIPKCTGKNIAPEVVAELAKVDNIKGVKDSSGNMDNLQGYIDAAKGNDVDVLVGSDGKILAALTDAIQPKITVSAEGEIVSKDYTATKRELGDDYNMVKYGNAIAEWDAQAKAFADYTVGMTADEVSAMETTEHNGHDVTVDETLFASCTMDITGMRATIATAANNAR